MCLLAKRAEAKHAPVALPAVWTFAPQAFLADYAERWKTVGS